MQSKLTAPLVVGIAATIAFNLLPIKLGFGILLLASFVPYAGLMVVLSFSDRRVLGYATVLTACNLANGEKLSSSLMLAVLAVLKESPELGRIVRELGKRRWWYLFLAAFLLVGLSFPFWPSSLRGILTEAKTVASHLGYLVFLPLAVGLTLRNPRDGVRAVALLCLMSAAFLGAFYFLGQPGVVGNASVGPDGSVLEVFNFIGRAYIGYNRTQVCIPLATLAAGALALAVCTGFNLRAVPCYLASGLCVFMIMLLASVGSALAMVCGMCVLALGYLGVHINAVRILWGGVLFFVVGLSLYWAVFRTENYLSQRIEERMQVGNADRVERWRDGIEFVLRTPIGHGMVDSTIGHSEYLTYLMSYGWPTGFCYIAGIGGLFISMWHTLRRQGFANPHSRTLLLVGLATLTVYMVNSIGDMPSASIVFYELIWALILTSATVVITTEPPKRASAITQSRRTPLLVTRCHRL